MARLRTFLILLLAGAALALVLSPAFVRDPVTGRLTLGLINPDDAEEVRQGREHAAAFVAANDGVYPDPEAAEFLGGIARRIGALSHRPKLPYRFTLLDTSVPNAFALPGGEVFLTRGLLVRLEEEADFAFVMAHEIAHVNHRHAVKAMNDALVVGYGTTVLSDPLGDERERERAAGLAAAGGGLLLLKFSRGQEYEADVLGAEYARRAGYDPRRALAVFRTFARLRAEGGGKDGLLETMLSSHPLDGDREERLAATIARRWPDLRRAAPAASSPRWKSLVARVRAATPAYDRLDRARSAAARALAAGDRGGAARAASEIAAAALPGHALFPAVEGSIRLALGEAPAARERLERAVALDPRLYLARVRLSALEAAAGRFDRAAAEARAAAALDPSSAGALNLLGRALEGAGDRPGAVVAHEAAARLAPSGGAEERAALARLAALDPRRYAPSPLRAPGAPR
jgi:predicted Zn-dependent protease